MNRRTAIQSLGLAASHALFPSILAGYVASCQQKTSEEANSDYAPIFFSDKEFEVLKEIIDLIIPATNSASASQVNVHHFIDEVFAKCLTNQQQAFIKDGFSDFIPQFEASTDKNELLTEIDKKAYTGSQPFAWFIPIKQYTLVGFFTSREGTTVASNFIPNPGDYKGEISLDASTLNYGLTSLRYYL